jgi:predicted nucleic acid-binding protein
LAFLDEVFNGVSILPFDLVVARSHARVYAELRAVGQLIGPNDLNIAVTALTHGLELLTHHFRHLERVPGLVVNVPAL